MLEAGFFALIGPVEVEDRGLEGLGGGWIRRLLCFHGGSDHGMGRLELLDIPWIVGLDPLGQEVAADGFLDLLGMLLLGHHPAAELVGGLA